MICSKFRHIKAFCSSKNQSCLFTGNFITQGKAKVYTKITQQVNSQKIENEVFYNPVQIFNRDCTILAIQTYINMLKKEKGEKFRKVKIIDALSASGLRAIRFEKQLQNVQTIYANDFSPSAHQLIKSNVDLNQIQSQKIILTKQDSNLLLYRLKDDLYFDVIDIDPYGSAIPFLDAAITNINDGGLICATFTDTRVLCGPDFAKCFYYYGTSRAKVQHYSQNALRIVLRTINSIANQHCKSIEPLFSIFDDFYLRVFIRVKHGKKQSALSSLNYGALYYCNSCGNYECSSYFTLKEQNKIVSNKINFQTNVCSVCSDNYHLNGPIWLGNLNDSAFIYQMMMTLKESKSLFLLNTTEKILGNLQAIKAEHQLSNIPLGFSFDKMCKLVKSPIFKKKQLFSAVQSLGYKIVESYMSPNIYKTNAHLDIIYDIIKSWKLQQVGCTNLAKSIVNPKRLKIIQRPIVHNPNFNIETEIEKNIRFQNVSQEAGPKKKSPNKKVIPKQ